MRLTNLIVALALSALFTAPATPEEQPGCLSHTGWDTLGLRKSTES